MMLLGENSDFVVYLHQKQPIRFVGNMKVQRNELMWDNAQQNGKQQGTQKQGATR